MSRLNKYLYSLTIILALVLATACSSGPAAPEQPAGSSDHAVENEADEEHAGEHQEADEEHALEHEEHEDDEEHAMEHEEHEGDEEHAREHNGDEEHEHSEARIPNNGAVIRITAPADGDVVKEGDDLVVEVETENFVLGEDGSHWHIYVDGISHGMIVGGDLDHVLRGLEPGQHEISAHLAIGTHEELEEGASITITVE